jgi:hypothetical protein
LRFVEGLRQHSLIPPAPNRRGAAHSDARTRV